MCWIEPFNWRKKMRTQLSRLGVLCLIVMLIAAACAPAATPAPQPTAEPQIIEVTRVVAGTPEVQVITATPPPAEPEKVFRVAIVMPSSITDAAFSQSMFEGLLVVQKEMGGEGKVEIAYSEGMFKVPDAAAAIRDYASQGFNFVIAHGSQYGTSLAQIAPDFPETSFAWGTSLDTFQAQGIGNVFAYQAEAQQGGYVLGTLAALMSQSGVIGISGPVEAGDAKLYVDGFKTGAEAAKPGIKVNVSYTGSFSDVSLMAAAAETHIAAGADMLTGSSQSVVGAIGVAKDKGAFWFGTQWDQTALAPETVVASQIYDWSGIIKDMIASHKAGVLGGKSYTLTFKNGGLKIQYNDKVAVPAEARAAVEAAITGIGDGTIKPLP
jgi:basic membrane protein A